MFTRVTNWKTKNLPQIVAALDDLEQKVKAIPGVKKVQVLWAEDGSGVTVASYDSAAAADKAAEQIQAIWASVGSLFSEPPRTTNYTSARIMI